MDVKIGPLFKCHADIETQIVKLSAWVQTLGYVLEGLDIVGSKSKKDTGAAVYFAESYPAYSEMLFLALSGLQECKETLDKLCEKEGQLITATE